MNTDRGQQTAHRGEDSNKIAPPDKRHLWDKRAQEFSEHSASTGYPEAFIRLMQPRKTWTVFDMGCGGGTIAVPLAKRVKSVTAVDFSEKMLAIVDQRCKETGILNVKTVLKSWEDNWELKAGSYDVAIASRSLTGDGVKDSIAKLDRIAQRAVYISTVVGTGPFDKRLFESTGRKFDGAEDYIYFYTMLYEMGIRANMAFIREEHTNQWDSHEDAFEDQRWMFRGMTKKEEDKVHIYLKRHLIQVMGRWRLPYSRDCYWAIMWWTKDRRFYR